MDRASAEFSHSPDGLRGDFYVADESGLLELRAAMPTVDSARWPEKLRARIGRLFQGHVLSWNQTAERLYRRTSDEMIGQRFVFAYRREKQRGVTFDTTPKAFTASERRPVELYRSSMTGEGYLWSFKRILCGTTRVRIWDALSDPRYQHRPPRRDRTGPL